MSRLPMLVSGCDVRSLPLTPSEAFLLSRVDAAADEQELALSTGFSPEQVGAMLDRLEALGAVAIRRGNVTQTRLRAEAAADRLGAVTPGTRLALGAEADADDPAAQRRKILARKLSGAMPRVAPRAPTPAERQSVLRAYEAVNTQAEQAAEATRRAEIERRLEEGSTALARRDFVAALDAYRAAASLAPDDPEMQATCDAGIRAASAELAEGHAREATAAENEGRWEDALLAWSRVCAGRPGDASAHQRGALAALRADNVRRAVDLARKAVELMPGSPKLHVTLARVYVAAGFGRSADGELDRALDLAPDDPEIQRIVSRTRSVLRSKTG